MKCHICKNGCTFNGFTSVVMQSDNCTVVFKNVPAEICNNCGEYYLDEEVSSDLLNRAKTAAQNGAEIEIIRYAA